MNSFVDTNVSIAYSFLIDPLNNHSRNAFSEYANIFWSELVKKEFNKVFISKKEVLVRFYKKLLNDLKQGNIFNLTFNNIEKYVKQGNYRKKDFNQIKGSLYSFWDRYVDETFPSADLLENAINLCLRDLRIMVYTKKAELENNLKLTSKRHDTYSNLKNKLRKKYAAPEVLIVDEWLTSEDIDNDDISFLLDLMEDRSDTKSTIFCTLYPYSQWNDKLKRRVIGQSVIDRIVHSAVIIDCGTMNMRAEKRKR